MDNNDKTLKQSRGKFCHREFTIQNERELIVRTNVRNAQSEYRIDVLTLAPTHKRQFSINIKWLVISLVVLVAMLVIDLVVIPSLYPEQTFIQVGAWVVMGLVLLFSLYQFFLMSFTEQCFFSRHAKVPLVRIWHRSSAPRKQFKAFVAYLEKLINTMHMRYNLDSQQQLSGEMKTLRRLRDENIISDSQYNEAQKKLFTKH